MPELKHIGVSTRIENEAERARLKNEIESLREHDQSGGFIVRTAAEGVSLDEIQTNHTYLMKLWETIQAKAKQAKSGEIIHEDLPLNLRALR